MNQPSPELQAEFSKLNDELRGYEVAKENDFGGWDKVMTTQPTNLGLSEAKRATNWLNWRHHKRTGERPYRLRVLVSMEIDLTPKTDDLDGALVEKFGEVMPAEPLTDEEAKIQQAQKDELDIAIANARDNAAGGFVVAGARGKSVDAPPVVPFDYAQQAADMPFDVSDIGGEA